MTDRQTASVGVNVDQAPLAPALNRETVSVGVNVDWRAVAPTLNRQTVSVGVMVDLVLSPLLRVLAGEGLNVDLVSPPPARRLGAEALNVGVTPVAPQRQLAAEALNVDIKPGGGLGPSFYLHTEEQRGFAYRPGWYQLAPPPAPLPPTPRWIAALTYAPDNPDKVYAIWVDDRFLRVSTDGGLSWSRSSAFQPSGASPQVFSLHARPSGELFYMETPRNASSMDSGISRSLDDGVTWTRIVTLPPNINGGGYMALGTSKLWYAAKTQDDNVSHPGVLWDIHRANFDGSGVETLVASVHLATPFSHQFLLRAISDTFVLAVQAESGTLWRVDSGGLTDIRPAALRPFDVLPLSASVFVAVGAPADNSSSDVLVYRTTNAGASWTLTQTVTELEGFALDGRIDWYRYIDACSPSILVMSGNADWNIQQITWVSTDAGVSWTQLLNAVDPPDTDPGTWLVTLPGGIVARPAVARGIDVRAGALGVLVDYVPSARMPVRWTGVNFVES